MKDKDLALNSILIMMKDLKRYVENLENHVKFQIERIKNEC